MKKSNSTSLGLKVTYPKRRDAIVKKATELSLLCGTNVGLILFSPKGKLTSFATHGRIEDIFLQYIEQSNELRKGCVSTNQANLHQPLKQLKREREMLEKLERIETLEGKLQQLNQQQREKQDKMKCYNYEMHKVSSTSEALLHQQFLTKAIHNVEHLKAKMINMEEEQSQNLKSIEVADVDSEEFDDLLTWGEYMNSEKNRNEVIERNQNGGTSGPHLSLEFLTKQKQWNLNTSSAKIPNKRV
ncbi:unnamed protein product [Linum trigynum]|uniref:MADS-box domain-containing protein n=1 Tax=Linum trigynum TaxID=586398 RepID=A0AAV2G9M4_9ROSI